MEGAGVVDTLDFPEIRRFDNAEGLIELVLYRELNLVRELVPFSAEELDTIVLVGIVARADHHTSVATHVTGQECDRRRRWAPDSRP